MADAAAIIAALGLAPHPEGGWYRELYRAETPDARSAVTTIYFLLEAGQASHWHRIDADEIWCCHAGAALALGVAAADSAPPHWQQLGGNVLAGEVAQLVVAAGHWQAARAEAGWVLVSCVVAPGFDFAGFELAPAGWSPGGGSGE